jgi:hypothetical protein
MGVQITSDIDNYLFAIGGSHVLDDVFTSVFTSSCDITADR